LRSAISVSQVFEKLSWGRWANLILQLQRATLKLQREESGRQIPVQIQERLELEPIETGVPYLMRQASWSHNVYLLKIL
jgi:hypothetical protein